VALKLYYLSKNVEKYLFGDGNQWDKICVLYFSFTYVFKFISDNSLNKQMFPVYFRKM